MGRCFFCASMFRVELMQTFLSAIKTSHVSLILDLVLIFLEPLILSFTFRNSEGSSFLALSVMWR